MKKVTTSGASRCVWPAACGGTGDRAVLRWLAAFAGVFLSLRAGAEPLKVCLMPSYRQHLTYANAVLNEPLAVWGRCWDGAGPFTYTLDYGDGTTSAGAVTNAAFIGGPHAYALAGVKTVTLTVSGGGETKVCQSVVRVFAAPTFDIRVNQAIEKGLLWIYRNKTELDAKTVRWTYASTAAEYNLAATGFAVLALEENGHLATLSPEEDVYSETVRRGLNYIFGGATKRTIAVQAAGNPDSNGNGVGAFLINSEHGTYATAAASCALVMAAQSMSAASNFVVTSGAYVGSNLVSLVQDIFDQFSYCQGDNLNAGGWVYSVSSADDGRLDGSSQQWPCMLFALGRDRWGLEPAPWVKAQALKGFQALQGADGGCRYSQSSYYDFVSANVAKTGGLLVGYNLGGLGAADAATQKALSFMGAKWAENPGYAGQYTKVGWPGDFYAMYCLKKGLHLQEVEALSTSLGSRKWYADLSAWLLGISEGSAEALAGMPAVPAALAPAAYRTPVFGFGQYADGSWTSGYGQMLTAKVFGAPLGVLMLTKVVTVMGPVAVIAPIAAQPVPRPPARPDPIPFVLDGSGSYHQDRTKSILQYLWDFDASDGVDWSNPDARGPRPVNPGYRALGQYTVTLCVTDDSSPAMSNKTTAVVTVTDQDVAPVAVPIPSYLPAYAGFIGQPILLDGGASYDPDGDTITNYTWDVNGNGVYGDLGDLSSALPTASVSFASEYVGAIGLRVAANGKQGDSSLCLADLYCTDSDIAVGAVKVKDFVLGGYAVVEAVFTNRVQSSGDYNQVLVRFYNGDPLRGGTQISSNLYVNLPRGVPVDLTARLVRMYGVEPDNIFVYVDADRAVVEGNELNNVARVSASMRRVVFSEDLEDGRSSLPADWTQVSEVGSYKWQSRTGGNNAEPPSAYNGFYNLYYQAQTTNDNRTKIITPEIDFGPAREEAQLTFWHCMAPNASHLPYGQDELRVYYRTSASGAWNLLAAYTESVTNWTLRTLSLPDVGPSYYLAFEGVAQWGRGVCVDDIVVMAAGPNAYAPVITTASPLPAATVKARYDYPLAATGGGGVYTWAVVSNSLPKGLGLVPATGVITGLPAVVGTTLFRVRCTGGEGLFDEAACSLTVQASIAITGKVTRNSTTNGVPGVLLVLAGGDTVTTDAGGYYSAFVRKGWVGTVTPAAGGAVREIVPTYRGYSNLTANATAQNYAWWEDVASIPLASYALLPENAAYKYKSVSGTWDYYFESRDLRCQAPAAGGSAAMQVTVTGPGLLAFTYELFGADGTNKLVCSVGSASRPARLAAGPAAVTVAVPAGVQTVKWTLTRGAKSAAASASVRSLAWSPLAKVASPVPADGASFPRVEFAGLGWSGDCDYCRLYAGLAAASLTALNTNRYAAGAVPAADVDARLTAAAGKTLYWRADAVRVDAFGVEAVNPGAVWSFTAFSDDVPNPEPEPDDTRASLTVGVRCELGPYAFENALGGTVTATVKSGAMPPGLKAEIRGSSLYLVGVPTRVGSYAPLVQLAVKVGTVTTPGGTVLFDLTVSPLGLAAGTFDGWIANSIHGQGTWSLTVSAAGAISGKTVLGGTNYTVSAASFGGETNDLEGASHFFARADLKAGTKVLTPVLVSVWREGRADVRLEQDPDADVFLFRNNWKEVGMTNILSGYLGYYNVVLPVTNAVEGDLGPRGSGYLSLTLSAGGAAKLAGVLADGNTFSYSTTLLYEPTNAVTGAEAKARTVFYTVPSLYKGRGGAFGVLAVGLGPQWEQNKKNVVLADVPVIWWNSTPQSVSGYNPVTGAGGGGFFRRLAVSGGYYDRLLPLQTYYAGRALSLSGSGAPEDYDGVGNSADTGLTFLSGPEDVGLTATATGFTVTPRTLVKIPGTALVDIEASVNPWGLSLVLNKSTGFFNGSFAAYYQNAAGTVQKTKSLSYKGLLVPVRAIPFDGAAGGEEGVEGRGFYLAPDKSFYQEGPILKSYPFNGSYDVSVESLPKP